MFPSLSPYTECFAQECPCGVNYIYPYPWSVPCIYSMHDVNDIKMTHVDIHNFYIFSLGVPATGEICDVVYDTVNVDIFA